MSSPIDLAAARIEFERKRREREEERLRVAAEEDARMEAELRELEKQEVRRIEEEKRVEEERKKEGERRAEEVRLAQERAERVEREKREGEVVVHRSHPVDQGKSRSPAKPALGESKVPSYRSR